MQICVAPEGLEDVVQRELGSRTHERHERLFVVDDHTVCHFAQNFWLDVQHFKFDSISQAAKKLRSLQRNWCLHSTRPGGRAKLIQEQLPPIKAKALTFPTALPTAPMGAWTLVDEHQLLYATQTTSPFPDGVIEFQENKTDPPSRAYLKLWEFFTLAQRGPDSGARVLDLGSSPGGWTWVLDQLGAQVLSVDKAPLAEQMQLSPRVEVIKESAFALDPRQVGKVDWLFSDIICYPERLLELILRWKDFVPNLVCTLKFQGPTDYDVIEEFLKIPGSQVRHLFHNKHELTWSRLS